MDVLDALPAVEVSDGDVAPEAAGDDVAEDIAMQFAPAVSGVRVAADAMLEDLPAMRGPNKRRDIDLFGGELYRSRRQMQFVRECKRRKAEEKKADEMQKNLLKVSAGWDNERQRYGDFINVPGDSQPNYMSISGRLDLSCEMHGSKSAHRVIYEWELMRCRKSLPR